MAITSFWDERKLFVFVTLIIVASVAMLIEIDAARRGERSLTDQIVSFVIVPIESAVSHTVAAMASEYNTLAHSGSMATQNAELQRKVQVLAATNERLKEHAAENGKLRRMLGLAQSMPLQPLAASVVGYAPEGSRKEVSIDRGWRDGVRRDSVVINGDGLVGHVIDAGAHNAHVLLVIDPTSNVPAYLRDTRTWGIVTGTWQHMRMKYIGQDVKVRPGDTVVTGKGEVYPEGIIVGTVREVDRRENALYQSAVIAPAVDFNGLIHVLVLKQ
ncbi:MAG: rod shape-determining protein MreC [Candidatus Eremiobacteraeota bacterium]|nr:rod shape-determining protein MreC [Candidatus Eremiobacteraeota bacterium]